MAVLFPVTDVGAQTSYRFEVVTRTGLTIEDSSVLGAGDLGTITDVARGPSINDAGRVAAGVGSGSDVRVLLMSRNQILKNLRIETSKSLANDLQVNNDGQISFRVEYIAGPRFEDAEVIRLDSLSTQNPLIASGPSFPDNSPFDFVNRYTSIDNFGRVLFSADLKSNGLTVLAADDDDIGPGPDEQSPGISGFPDLFPKAADNDRVVVRFGGNSTSPLYTFLDRDLSTAIVLADGTSFTRVGSRPAISDDGRAVAFLGEHTSLGAGLFFVYFVSDSEQYFTPLVSLPASSDLDRAVGVNLAGTQSWIYTVVFLADDTSGNLGLYAVDVDSFDPASPTLSPLALLAEQGGTIGEFTLTVADLDVYDPVNNRGEIVFWVLTAAGTQAAIRAIPESVEILDPACSTDTWCGGLLVEDTGNGFAITSSDELKAGASVRRVGAATDGVTMLLLRVRADQPVDFVLRDPFGAVAGPEWGQLMAPDGSGAGASLLGVPTVVTSEGEFAFAAFRVPTDFPGGAPFVPFGRDVSIEATFGGNQRIGRLTLHPPPVVLVHGIWSGADAWKGLDHYLELFGYRICDTCRVDYGRLFPAANFDPTLQGFSDRFAARQLVRSIDGALADYRELGTAVSQVDVVGHSMGALVARSHVMSRDPLYPYRELENYGAGSIHKLISVGTPHWGSPLADVLTEHKCTERQFRFPGSAVPVSTNLEFLFESLLKRPLGPGLYGLQTSSFAVANLGATPVHTHAIEGTAPANSITETLLDAIVATFVGGGGLDARLGPGHDTIVPLDSQGGGLEAAHRTLISEPVIHANLTKAIGVDIGETESQEVFSRVLDLLATEQLASSFAPRIPAHRLTATPNADVPCSSAAASGSTSGNGASPGDVSLLPASGTVVNSGANVTISFEIGTENPVDGALIVFDAAATVVAGPGPFSVDLPAPIDRIGLTSIAAITYGPGPVHYAASTEVDVQTSAILLGLDPGPDRITLRGEGELALIYVIGRFSDGVERPLGPAAQGTTYTIESGTASVISMDPDGLVTAVAEGTERVTVANGLQTAAIEVIVDYPECADGLDNDGDGAIDVDGSPSDPECLAAWHDDEASPTPLPQPRAWVQWLVAVGLLWALRRALGRSPLLPPTSARSGEGPTS